MNNRHKVNMISLLVKMNRIYFAQMCLTHSEVPSSEECLKFVRVCMSYGQLHLIMQLSGVHNKFVEDVSNEIELELVKSQFKN